MENSRKRPEASVMDIERTKGGSLWALTLGTVLFSCVGPRTVGEATETPELFAPGVISTRGREFATSFSPDGRTVYFNRVDNESRIEMLQSRWRNGAWGPPERVGFSDGTFRDVDPFVASNGRRLFFTADRNEIAGVPSPDFDVWVAERVDGAWSKPVRLPSPPNSSASEAFVSVTDAGTLYFGSTNTHDGVRRVMRSELSDGAYDTVEEVELGLASGVGVGNPLILPDESALFFTSRDLPGAGAVDIFVSYRDANGNWSEPLALPAPINSPFGDFAPGLGPGGRTLFFTSERPGIVPAGEIPGRPPGDLYFVRLPERASSTGRRAGDLQ